MDKDLPLASLWGFFHNHVFDLPSTNGDHPLFNPYRDIEPDYDRETADQIRRANLQSYLESFETVPEILILGEAPGWKGCRFSGVPFTSEAQLAASLLPFRGEPSSLRPAPYHEASATIFWRDLLPYFDRFIVWNCIPLHPHKPGSPRSNRTPVKSEHSLFSGILLELTLLLRPTRILAVGRTAQNALESAGLGYWPIRHPAHGGAAAFRSGVCQAFEA